MPLNADLIKRTVICYWSEADDSYIAVSPLFDMTAGFGETADEALAAFHNNIDAFAEDYQNYEYVEGKMQFQLSLNVRQRTMTVMKLLTQRFDCSMDDAFDYIVGYLLVAGMPESPKGPIRKPLDDVIAS